MSWWKTKKTAKDRDAKPAIEGEFIPASAAEKEAYNRLRTIFEALTGIPLVDDFSQEILKATEREPIEGEYTVLPPEVPRLEHKK